MNVLQKSKTSIDVRLNPEELGLLGNALNEVCHGVDLCDAEFQTRLGTERKDAKTLLDQLVNAYRQSFEAEKGVEH